MTSLFLHIANMKNMTSNLVNMTSNLDDYQRAIRWLSKCYEKVIDL